MTDQLGQSQVIPYVKGLSADGVSMTILSAEKHEAFIENKDRIEAELKQCNVSWEYIAYTKFPPVISTIKDIARLRKKAEKLYLKEHFDICHCRSYIAALVGMYLKNHYGVKFVFDMRGFYADERVDGKIWNLSNPVFRLVFNYFKKKEIEFLKHADYIVSLTHKAKDIISSWNIEHNLERKIEVIPCCADLYHFSPDKISISEKSELKKELRLNDGDYVISYLGSLGTWYMEDEMMRFFKLISIKYPNSKFLFITKDSKQNIFNLTEKHHINKQHLIIRPATRNEVPALLSLSDFSLFFIKPVFSKSASSPTKLAEILGMGIPVVCNSGVGDIDKIFQENEAGLLVKEFNEKCYNDVILKLNSLKEILPEKYIATSSNLFSLHGGVSKYYNIYKKITNQINA